MTLFEIDEAIANCVKLEDSDGYVDISTGEVIDTAALEALQMEKSKKLRNIGCWILNLKSDIEALDAQEKVFKNRKKAAERKMESLKNYLSMFLNGQKFECAEVKIGWRESESVEVTCPARTLPEMYLRFAEPEPNKTLLKADIKAGKVIPGAEIVKKKSIQIR